MKNFIIGLGLGHALEALYVLTMNVPRESLVTIAVCCFAISAALIFSKFREKIFG
ncbi:MAG: hypothetical protein WAV31_01905 [Candidatus Moraniibacteriota bacterium]